ncbi:uncharacterized protein [Amphiura filiformis]|uniref:uncharacterized protein n=1 Tax=Amphiura filiformis TaxID=82378 RepID=UPI003B211F74
MAAPAEAKAPEWEPEVASPVGVSTTGRPIAHTRELRMPQAQCQNHQHRVKCSNVIFNSGIWAEHQLQDHPYLDRLAKMLPDVMLGARAKSTVSAYSGAMNRWTDWANKYGKCVLPADSVDIALYLTHLSQTATSPAPITKAVSGLSWAHKMAGVPDPTSASMVLFTHEGLKRKLSKPIVKKEPITSQMIRDLVDAYVPEGRRGVQNLMNIRTVTMCLVAYSAFLRFDELSEIKLRHLNFTEKGVEICIPSSKTDVYRQGRSVAVSKLNTPTCPVKMLEVYLDLVQVQSEQFIFRSLTKTREGYKLREGNQPISYTRAREVILESIV